MKSLTPVKQGGTIGVLAPAFPADPDKIEKGITYLKGKGFTVKRGKSLTAQHLYFSGSDELRVQDLHDFFADPEIDMIICARGGWGTLRLLDQLDYRLIAQNPKPLVGYSDITTLQLAILKRAGLPSLSGPMVAVEMAGNMLPFTEQHFWQQVFNPQPYYHFSFVSEATEIWHEGQISGPLIGGCLSMLAHQLGTPFMPDLEGAVLFLEDVGEAPYKIDRYLAQLKQAGIFNQISGLLLGQFLDCVDDNESRKSIPLEVILKDYFAQSSYPVVYNFPYGHGARKFTMPIGVQIELNTRQKWLKLQNPFYKS